MSDTMTAIEKLKSLLKANESEKLETPALLDSSGTSPKVNTPTGQVTLSRDPDARPKSLEGLRLLDILLLQADGFLDLEAEEWLSLKNIPNPDGSWRPPNLLALQRARQRMNKET